MLKCPRGRSRTSWLETILSLAFFADYQCCKFALWLKYGRVGATDRCYASLRDSYHYSILYGNTNCYGYGYQDDNANRYGYGYRYQDDNANSTADAHGYSDPLSRTC